MKSKIKNGFSLIELMVTIGIVGIVMSIAIPSFNSMISGDRLVSYRNLLTSDFMLARSKAVESNQSVFLCASSDGSSCTDGSYKEGWIIVLDDNGDNAVTDVDTLFKVQQAITGDIEFKLSDDALSTITIDERGFTPDSTGIISVCDDRGNDHAKTISISKTGRASRRAKPTC